MGYMESMSLGKWFKFLNTTLDVPECVHHPLNIFGKNLE